MKNWTQVECAPDKQDPTSYRVEAINTETGDCYVAIFTGPESRERAFEYHTFLTGVEWLASRESKDMDKNQVS